MSQTKKEALSIIIADSVNNGYPAQNLVVDLLDIAASYAALSPPSPQVECAQGDCLMCISCFVATAIDAYKLGEAPVFTCHHCGAKNRLYRWFKNARCAGCKIEFFPDLGDQSAHKTN